MRRNLVYKTNDRFETMLQNVREMKALGFNHDRLQQMCDPEITMKTALMGMKDISDGMLLSIRKAFSYI